MKKVIIKGFPIVKGEVRNGAILEIPVPAHLNDLALSKDGDDWDLLCKRLPSYGFMNPIGKMHITHLVIDGKEKVFH
jgi:hypothetical protein|tara:strand:- start:395 stop:625 length:231 start_codon:yes stop_codon:yes gene_type:complete